MKVFVLALLPSLTLPLVGQQTTVTGTVTDSAGITWANAAITPIYIPYRWSGSVYNGPSTWNGTSYPAGLSAAAVTAATNGTFTITVPANDSITGPDYSTWAFQICPRVSGASCQTVSGQRLSSGSLTLSTTALVPPVTNAVQATVAYDDSEIISPAIGRTYYNLTTSTPRVFNGMAWIAGGGGTAGAPVTNPAGGANNYAPIDTPQFTGVAYGNPNPNSVILADGWQLHNNNFTTVPLLSTNYGQLLLGPTGNGSGSPIAQNGLLINVGAGNQIAPNKGLQVGASMTVDGATGIIKAPLLIGSSGTPTIAVGAGAGTSPGTSTFTGNNLSGVVSIATGTSPATGAVFATITFNGTLATAPQGCQLTPRNSATAAANLVFFTTAPSTTSFTINTGSTAPVASTTYSWSVLCI